MNTSTTKPYKGIKNMLCAHGTTLDNLKKIMTGQGKDTGTWKVSDCDGCTYFYPFDKVALSHGISKDFCDSEDEYNACVRVRAIHEALGNALITASLSEKDCEVVVLIADVPDELLEDDFSCPSMSDIASFIQEDEWNNSMALEVLSYKFKGMYAPYFYPQHSKLIQDVSPELKKLAKAVSDSGCCDIWCSLTDSIQETEKEVDIKSLY